jgi:hypothetical protein
MKRLTVLCGSASLCILLSAAVPALAEWAPDGLPVVESDMEEGEFPPLNFGMFPDGHGGAIIVWRELHEGTDYDIFAQRIDSRGNFLWPSAGIPVCAAQGDQYFSYIVSDGSGGWFAIWTDNRNGDSDIYAQRLDASGNPIWATDGVAIYVAGGYQKLAGAIPDGSGGVIVLWMDSMDGNCEYSFGALLIDANAGTIWTAENITGSIPSCCERSARIASDGAGGAIIAWENTDEEYGCNSWDILVQRLDSTGELRWGSTGVLIVEDVNFLSPLLLQPDGSGGAIMGWTYVEASGAYHRLFAQHVLSNGRFGWADGGIRVCAAQEDQISPVFVSDGSGGVIATWATLLGDSDIFAQRIDRYGDLLWAAEGIPVCTTPTEQQTHTVVSDGSGGAIVSWTDFPRPYSDAADIYAQHITGEGIALWQSGGLPVCTATGQQAFTLSVPDGAGGAIVRWVDSRSGSQDGYIQKIDRHGNWGYPAPAIEDVSDIPGDQGGYIDLSWSASRLDPWPSGAIDSYSIWRAISHEQATLVLKGGGSTFSSAADIEHDPARPLLRVEQAGGRTFYWMYISTVEASRLDGYSEVVPTLFDITAVCDDYHYFQVIAHGSDPDMLWISRPDSGRSSDDLSPSPPAGLAGTAGPDVGGLHLSWDRGAEKDLDHYAVYRGPAEGFEASPANLLAVVADTMYTDGEWSADDDLWYKVTAIDVHGNESACASLDPEDITGVSAGNVPSASFLAQNFPNPFNPSTTIVFGLKERGFVSLRIYDAAGRLVRVLVEKDFDAGIHEEHWDGLDERGAPLASGVYFCSLKSRSFAVRKKMVILR